MLLSIAIVIATVAVMEGVAWVTHRTIMHGPIGWGWHRSHHAATGGPLERNDLYAVVFSVISAGFIMAGSNGVWPMLEIGIGFIVYGALYFVVHDGFVHERWLFRYVPKRGYLKRLVQAHKMHHAVEGRDGCVSFGFLYAPPIAKLKADLRGKRTLDKRAGNAPADGAS